jgi:23S rRNA (adenine-N6)-dimethyltransferase
VPGRPPSAPNPAGAHFLRDRALIARLVRASGARDGHLVLDLGAGRGAITAELAASGARVIAVEFDPRLAAGLRRRFDGDLGVRVVEADLRSFPLPRREFLVVASPPFSLTTALCRRLLGDSAVPLAGAELILQRGAARWLASPRPRDGETAWWAARYELRIGQTIGSASFVPPPRADAARLSVRPRPITESAHGQRLLRTLLRAAYRRPGERVSVLLGSTARMVLGPRTGGARTDAARAGAARAGAARTDAAGVAVTRAGVTRAGVAISDCGQLLIRADVDPRTPAALLTAEQWHRLAFLLAAGPRG